LSVSRGAFYVPPACWLSSSEANQSTISVAKTDLISSGVLEVLYNKAKVTMRKSCGFRTYRVPELALYHSLGKLPEPELTHEFF